MSDWIIKCHEIFFNIERYATKKPLKAVFSGILTPHQTFFIDLIISRVKCNA